MILLRNHKHVAYEKISIDHSIYYIELGTIEMDAVTQGNVLLHYHGHEINWPFPRYQHLSMVAHVGGSHSRI
jgi:hypothetical protein